MFLFVLFIRYESHGQLEQRADIKNLFYTGARRSNSRREVNPSRYSSNRHALLVVRALLLPTR